MTKCKQIMLKHQEIEYLNELSLENQQRGEYRGRRDYFYARQERVIGKLSVALNTKVTTNQGDSNEKSMG
jgi:hypothetical protein